MTTKKMVSTEPEWAYVAKKRRRTALKDTVTPITYNAAIPEACFKFGGKYAELLGEKHVVFSKLDDPNRIYFKIDDRGYKVTRTNRGAYVKFKIYDMKEKFEALWCGKSYEINEERGYYFIERRDELENLFETPRLELQFITEKKTDRMQLLIRPSSRDALKKIADEKATSVNDLVNKIVENYIDSAETKPALRNGVSVTPTPESVINDKKVLALLSNLHEKGSVSLVDIKAMNMNDREYFKALNDLIITYGYATVQIPCINHTGKRFYVTALYNGTGEWK